MYDINGTVVVGIKDKEIKNIFGTLHKSNRTAHRRYLRSFSNDSLYAWVNSIFIQDELYKSYVEFVPKSYQKNIQGLILLRCLQTTLLWLDKSYYHKQQTLEATLAIQILFLRKKIFSKLFGLYNNNYGLNEKPQLNPIPKRTLIIMATKIADRMEVEASRLFPKYIECVGR